MRSISAWYGLSGRAPAARGCARLPPSLRLRSPAAATLSARRIVADIDRAVDVVGLTVAEFIPRQVMHLQQVVDGFPLIG